MAQINHIDQLFRTRQRVYVHSIVGKRLYQIGETLESIMTHGILSPATAEQTIPGFSRGALSVTRESGSETPTFLRSDVAWVTEYGKRTKTNFKHLLQSRYGDDSAPKILIDSKIKRKAKQPSREERQTTPIEFNDFYLEEPIHPRHIIGVVLPYAAQHRKREWVKLLKKFNKPIYSHEGKILYRAK